jgi:hypothetical protein
MIDLQLFTALLGERLVVSHLSNESRYTGSKLALQLPEGGLCVLKGVVQYRRSDDLGALNPSLLCQHARDGEWVVDVGRSSVVFASLMTVLIGGECRGSQY